MRGKHCAPFLIGPLLAAFFIAPAWAVEPPCDDAIPRQFVFEHLGKKYQEQPVQFGVTSNGLLLEVFAKEDGDTWTLVATTPDGKSCIVASGNHWTKAPPVVKGTDA